MEQKSVLFFSILLLGAGCTKQTPVPQVASSATSPRYALAYPGGLSDRLTRYTEHSTEVKDNGTAFASYPDALKEPDWERVALVYEAADEAGRGEAFKNEMEMDRYVRQFFEEEKDDLTRRANNAVTNAIKKTDCNCEADTHGAVAFALKDGVEKRLEKRLQEIGTTEILLTDNADALGKKNIKILSEQAATISLSAHIAYVELPTIYQELEQRLDEAKAVKKTLQNTLADENAKLQDATRSRAEKKEAEKNIAAINDAFSTIEIFEDEAERMLERGIEEIPAIQKSYDAAFNGLIEAVEARKPENTTH